MSIKNLPEFAKNGQKNIDGLNLEDGFPVNLKPARQWFNFLFNQLAISINAINEDKLNKDDNAKSTSKLETARKITYTGDATGELTFDGSKDVSCQLTLPDVTTAYDHGMPGFFPVITVDAKGRVLKVNQQSLEQASINTYGITKLNDSLTSTSKNEALTANQGRILNETKLSLDQSLYKQKRSYYSFITSTGLRITRVDLPPQFGGEFTVTVVGSGGSEGSGSVVMKGATYPVAKQSPMQCIYISPQIQSFVYVDPTVYYDNANLRAYFYIYRYDYGFLNTSVYVDVVGTSNFSGDVTFSNAPGSVPLIIKKNELSFLGDSDSSVLFYTPKPWPTMVPPDGYLMMMGQAITQAQYPKLFNLYGSKLPDMRGEFIRGWDNGRGIDTWRDILSAQYDEFRTYTHTTVHATVRHDGSGSLRGYTDGPEYLAGDGESVSSYSGGAETRPRNIAFNYIVKAG